MTEALAAGEGRDPEVKPQMSTTLAKPIRARPRLITAVLVGGLLWFILPGRVETRLLAAWDCATGLYLILALAMMARASIGKIRDRAAGQDEGQMVILGLTTVTALVSLAGVMMELAPGQDAQGPDGWRHVAARRDHRRPVLVVPAHHVRGPLCARVLLRARARPGVPGA